MNLFDFRYVFDSLMHIRSFFKDVLTKISSFRSKFCSDMRNRSESTRKTQFNYKFESEYTFHCFLTYNLENLQCYGNTSLLSFFFLALSSTFYLSGYHFLHIVRLWNNSSASSEISAMFSYEFMVIALTHFNK